MSEQAPASSQKEIDDFLALYNTHGSTDTEPRVAILPSGHRIDIAYDKGLSRYVHIGTPEASQPQNALDQLSPDELAFVTRVAIYNGGKLDSGYYDGEDNALWTKPESLGIIRTVGSYKWLISNEYELFVRPKR